MTAHRSTRHEDSCSLVCEVLTEGDVTCSTYVGRHVRGVS